MTMTWKEVQLGNVCDFQNGFAFKSELFHESGTPLLRISNIQNESVSIDRLVFIDPSDYKEDLSRYKVVKDDLLIAMSGATTGKIGINQTDSEYFLNQRVGKFSPRKGLDKRFLYYFLSTKVEDSLAISIGSAQPNLSTQQIKEFKIPLPPLPEQKRIVAIVDEAFEGIDRAIANTKKNLTNARELFESYLNAIFTQKGDGWMEKKLHGVVEPSCSLSYGIVQPGNDYENGLPIVRPTNLTTKTIKLGSLKRIDPVLADSYKRTKLRGGELLLCVRGSTGVVGIAVDELKGANVTRGIVPIRFEQSLVIQAFGYYMLISKMIQEQIREKTYGTALMQINICDLRDIVLSFPKQEEQQTLVEKLDRMENETQRLEAIYQQKLAALTELKQSILQKAFTGELTADNANQVTKTAKEVIAA